MKKHTLSILTIILLTITLTGCSESEPVYISNPFTSGPGTSIDNPIYTVSFNGTYPSHHLTHQNGGTDEISLTGLSGLLADDQHVLDTEVVSAIENASPLTLPAFTMGGEITTGGYDFNLGSDYVEYYSTGAGSGLSAKVISNSSVGAVLSTYLDSSSPADNDNIGYFNFSGKNSAGTPKTYFQMIGVSEQVLSTNMRGKVIFNLMNGTSYNQVAYINADGDLYIDGSYETFDEYSDVELLKKGIKDGDKSILENAGILEKKYKLDDKGIKVKDESGNYIEDGYMVNVQRYDALVAGAIYQLEDRIDNLEERISELELLIGVSK